MFFSLVGKERKVRLLSLARESKIKESVPSKKLCSRNTEKTYKTCETEQIFFDGCGVLLRAPRARVSKTAILIKISKLHRRKTKAVHSADFAKKALFNRNFCFILTAGTRVFRRILYTAFIQNRKQMCNFTLCGKMHLKKQFFIREVLCQAFFQESGKEGVLLVLFLREKSTEKTVFVPFSQGRERNPKRAET